MNESKCVAQATSEAVLVRGGAADVDLPAPKFHFHFEHFRAGQKIDEWDVVNGVTTEGKNSLLDVYFDAATQITSWFLGLISSVSYSALAATDTAAQINGSNGWKEAGPSNAPNYDTPATDRGSITFAEPSAGSLDASATIDFTFSGSGTVKGSFIVSSATREGTAGVLYSTALFSGDKTVADNDQLKVSVTVSFS